MNKDLYSRAPGQVVLYGVSWCGDCRRARRVFAQVGTAYLDVDVDADTQAEAFVKDVNRGSRSVPTIIFPDGSLMVEPGDDELRAKLQSL